MAQPPTITLTEGDLPALRALRASLRRAVAHLGPTEAEPAGSLSLRLRPDGRVEAHPMGHGAGWVTPAVLAESHHAQESHTWQRLKICRNELCGYAFYDRSRNNSGVWHDVRECGNAINLRASRARRKQQAQPRADNTPEAG